MTALVVLALLGGWLGSPVMSSAASGAPPDHGNSATSPDVEQGPGDESGTADPAAREPKAETFQAPFSCPPGAPGLLFQYPGDVPPTQVDEIDIVTGDSESGTPIADRKVNATGYNVLDNFIYGWDQQTDQIVRVHSDGSADPLGVPAGLPVQDWIIGDVDENGHYWLFDTTTGGWYQIDLATLTVVDSGTATTPAPDAGADWVFVPGTNALYRVAANAAGDQSLLQGFDRTTQTWSDPVNLGNLGGAGSNNAVGAVFADPDGNLYASYNQTGEIWRIDVGTQEATLFSDGPSSQQNDGARCATSAIPVDFGDAPSGTLLADDGARHAIPAYDDATSTAPLMLGSSIDVESDGIPSAGADGDDTTDTADEDGVADPIVMRNGQPTTVPVTVTNNTEEPATLAGWIDLDGSGAFDPAELVTATVPASSGTTSHDLVFPATTEVGDKYARFRLFSGDVDTPSPTGSATAGEVEDYAIPAGQVVPSKSVQLSEDPAVAGTVLTYTLRFENEGQQAPGTFTKVDDLGAALDDADLTEGPTASSDDLTVSAVANGRFTVTGTLDPGQVETVTYKMTARPDGQRGDNLAVNILLDPEDPPVCDPDAPTCDPPPCPDGDPLCTRTGIVQLLDWKTVDPASDTPVIGGERLTYTLTFTNQGQAVGKVRKIEDLTHVLDDAELVDGPTVSNQALSASKPNAKHRMGITGALEPGDTAQVSFTVQVKQAEDRGDNVLANFLLDPNQPTPDPVCDPADPERPDCTVNPVGNITATKSVDPRSGTTVAAHDELTYTLKFANNGEGASQVDFTDHLDDVLDDAFLIKGPAAAGDELAVSQVKGGEFTVTGTLQPGETARVTFTVEVHDYGELGNSLLANFLTRTGEDPPAECVDSNPRCTENPIETEEPPLPGTGAGMGLLAMVGVATALVLGGLTMVVAVRRSTRAAAREQVANAGDLS